MSLVFAPMQEVDLPAVLEIERLSFPKPWTTGLFLNELRLDISRQIVAREGEGRPLLGYACWWLVAGEAHILNVAVDPARRRAGLGKQLVDQILVRARGEGASLVGLEVREENEAALALYGSCGFERVGVRPNYYGAGVDAVLMDRRMA